MVNTSYAQQIESQVFVNDIFVEQDYNNYSTFDSSLFALLILVLIFVFSLFAFLRYKKYLFLLFHFNHKHTEDFGAKIIEEKEIIDNDTSNLQPDFSYEAADYIEVQTHDVDVTSDEYLNKKPELQIQIENDVAKLVFK